MTIFPYSKINGEWNAPDSILIDAYNRTVKQNCLKRIFWDGLIKTDSDFINYFKSDRNIVIFGFIDGIPCGYAWINNIGVGHASVHFCVFKEFWGSEHKEDMFESVVNYFFSFKDGERHLFDTLIGMVPKFNKHAIKYTKENGFNLVGEIPNMVNDIFRKRKSPIVIFYRSRNG